MSFSSFNLDPRVVAGIPQSFTAPTPIQTQAIPGVMAGKDMLGLAQTGTGKTAAFALPMLHRLVNGPQGKLRGLIVAPTRELADQIWKSVQGFASRTGLTATTIYGGVAFGPQAQRLRKGVDIVVGCPGRILDHMQQRTIDLSHVEVLVLDEADHMFDMGFLPNIRRILRAVPRERQTLLFSATMPEEIRGLANEALRNPEVVQIGHRAPVHTVSHWLYPVDQAKKTDLLLELLKKTDSGSVLVFARTKHRAKKLSVALEAAGHKAASLQGNLSQQRRQAALSGFRTGRYQILVATDIASRGIDVASVTHVINYDIPDTVEAYTHRIGRTGRAEKTGDAFTFVTHEDEGMVRSIERVLGSKIERRALDGIIRSDRGSESASSGPRQRSYGSRGGSQGSYSRGGPRGRPGNGGHRNSERSSERNFDRADSRGSDSGRSNSGRPGGFGGRGRRFGDRPSESRQDGSRQGHSSSGRFGGYRSRDSRPSQGQSY